MNFKDINNIPASDRISKLVAFSLIDNIASDARSKAETLEQTRSEPSNFYNDPNEELMIRWFKQIEDRALSAINTLIEYENKNNG